jgi:hypothetical protein
MLLNHMSLAELNHIDWVNNRDEVHSLVFKPETNLLTQAIFRNKVSIKVFKDIFGLSDTQVKYSTIEAYDSMDRYESEYLRYCPACLSMGFHSPFHQIRIFARCMIHGELLVTQCVHCRRKIPYSFQNGESFHPFGCPSCGHIYMSNERAVKNQIGDVVPEIADFLGALLAIERKSSVAYEKKFIQTYASAPESLYGCQVTTIAATNRIYQRNHQMTLYRLSDIFSIKINYLSRFINVLPPKCEVIKFGDFRKYIDFPEGVLSSSLGLFPIFKSIQRHLRKICLKPAKQFERIRYFEKLGEGAAGSVIKYTDDTSCVLAAAYINMSLHHEYLMKPRLELRYRFLSQIPEQHGAFRGLVENEALPQQLKTQLISRILAEDCYSGFIEYALRALAQRKRGKLIFESCHRDQRYDAHWIITVSNDHETQLHLWSTRPSLKAIVRYVRRHGY